jgi:DNA modification methylase
MPVVVRPGDCLDVMRTMPDASVHAIVTDPPYGLAEHNQGDVEKALMAWLTGDREQGPHGSGLHEQAVGCFRAAACRVG